MKLKFKDLYITAVIVRTLSLILFPKPEVPASVRLAQVTSEDRQSAEASRPRAPLKAEAPVEEPPAETRVAKVSH